VVNSSQGGGSKDTWVLREAALGEDILEDMRQKLAELGPKLGQRYMKEERSS
jgi:hypothetical protein